MSLPPSSLDLTGAWAKMDAARRHIKLLEDELGFPIRGDNHGPPPVFRRKADRVILATEYEPKTREHVIRVEAIPERPVRYIATLIGDAIHNLRSALDHLVWQFALECARGKVLPKGTVKQIQFPVYGTSEAFRKSGVVAHLEPMRTKALARLQPYHGPNGRVIRAVHNMDLRDKHRLLVPTLLRTGVLTGLPVGSTKVKYIEGPQRIHVGAVIARFRLHPNAEGKREVKGYLTPSVALAGRGHPCLFLERAESVIGSVLTATKLGTLPALGHAAPKPKRVETYEEIVWA